MLKWALFYLSCAILGLTLADSGLGGLHKPVCTPVLKEELVQRHMRIGYTTVDVEYKGVMFSDEKKKHSDLMQFFVGSWKN